MQFKQQNNSNLTQLGPGGPGEPAGSKMFRMKIKVLFRMFIYSITQMAAADSQKLRKVPAEKLLNQLL